MSLPRLLAAVAEHCARHRFRVLLAFLLMAVASSWLAAQRLGISTNTDQLFADSLPWRQRELAFTRSFPQFRDLLVGVVDGATPEAAAATATALAQAMAADRAHFRTVRQPDASPWLEANGMLFLDTEKLTELLNRTIDAQPFLGQLAADPSARGLFAALALLAMGVDRAQVDLTPFDRALEAFHTALAAAVAGHPAPLSWQRLLGGSLADAAGPYRFVLAQPVLDYGALEPGGAATRAMRDAAGRLEFIRDGTAHLRITGAVALADEEFATVAQGALTATLASVALVILWLTLAVRSWRLIGPIIATLGLGLLLTTGFAALAVGQLNLISVAFAVLFVGIAGDFAIQFCVRYRESRLEFPNPSDAMYTTGGRVGPQVLVAAIAVAAGFLAFVPTEFRGVAELGLIAGVGMLIALVCTITFLPAALSLFRPRGENAELGFAWGDRLEQRLVRASWLVPGAFALLAAAGIALLPRLAFDSDPLHTKDASTEAMRTLYSLMETPLTNPYSVDVLVPSAEAADALAERLRHLPSVSQVVTLDSFVPTRQAEKLPLLADAASILAASLAPQAPAAAVTPSDLRLAAQTALSQIDKVAARLPPGHRLLPIGQDLRALAVAPDDILIGADAALTRFLPRQLAVLRAALTARPVTDADIPPEIARDWRAPDGRVRVQAMAVPGARGGQALRAFVAEVQTVAPDAGGPAVTINQTAATIIGAFRTAALGAVLAIAALLFAVLRRAIDVLLVMASLLLSALITVVVVVLLPLPLNFANIIALPLLQGVGVSFNVYFVMNWRAGARRYLGTGTARAILFSALTTATAFGSLALSAHPGTASMGDLLLISLAATLAVTFVFLPTVLRRITP
jgi:hopanoid biosynthesis associated RND transporter like protein HpnN